MAMMRAPQVAIRDGEWCGIGWRVREVEGVTLVEHSGGTNGQYAVLSVAPDWGFVFACQTNSAGPLGKVHRLALEVFLGLSQPAANALESTTDELAALAGAYRREPASMDISMVGGRLVAVVTSHWGFPDKDKPPGEAYPPFSLARCDADRLLITDGSAKGRTMDVLRDGAGAIRWIRHGGRLYQREA
jgi:hypothetical protein